MTILCFPAGTDVAEMALFDVDALPQRLPRDIEEFAACASHGQLIRFPVGGDGDYLLHLFANEPIPVSIIRYCKTDDTLTGAIYISRGRIAFGGLESAYAEFRPNPNIRADGWIEPGRYVYTAYKTEFPDEMVMQAIRVERTNGERWLSLAPAMATCALFVIAYALVIARQFAPAGAAFFSSFFVGMLIRRFPNYRTLAARREHAQLAFPNIVVELQSDSSLEPVPDVAA